MPEHQLLIGACGWEHPDWQDQFYPDDLPEDWRLTYYSNNYRVLLLPAEYLRAAKFDVETLLEDSDPSLRFIFELSASDIDDSNVLTQQFDRLAELAERGAGMICRVNKVDASAMSELLPQLQKYSARFPVCMQLPDEVDAGLLEDCAQHGLGVVWNGHATPFAHSKLNVARIAETAMTAKELRRIVETCLEWGEAGETTVLLFDGQPPALQLMDNAGVILELL